VLNKAEPNNGIDLQELLRVYPQGFAAVLPYSRDVSRSLNAGQPVLIVEPKAEISLKLLEAGAKLVPTSEVTNPTWGARPAGRMSRSARRKERNAQAATATPTPTAMLAHHEALAGADWPQVESSVQSAPAARAPALDEAPQLFEVDEAPSLPPPTHGPSPVTPPGRTYPAPAATGPKDSLLTRFRLSVGARLWGPDEVASEIQQAAMPSLSAQMQVGPLSSSGPLRVTPQSSFGAPKVPSEEDSSSLVFSGSRRATSPPQRPQGRRERPTETPKTNGKERRR
jgi:hypothetical protein